MSDVRFPKSRWNFGDPPPRSEPQPEWTRQDPSHPPWLTYGDVKQAADAIGLPLCNQPECTRVDHLIGYLRTRVGELERERSFWENRYNELLDAVGGVWPG